MMFRCLLHEVHDFICRSHGSVVQKQGVLCWIVVWKVPGLFMPLVMVKLGGHGDEERPLFGQSALLSGAHIIWAQCVVSECLVTYQSCWMALHGGCMLTCDCQVLYVHGGPSPPYHEARIIETSVGPFGPCFRSQGGHFMYYSSPLSSYVWHHACNCGSQAAAHANVPEAHRDWPSHGREGQHSC